MPKKNTVSAQEPAIAAEPLNVNLVLSGRAQAAVLTICADEKKSPADYFAGLIATDWRSWLERPGSDSIEGMEADDKAIAEGVAIREPKTEDLAPTQGSWSREDEEMEAAGDKRPITVTLRGRAAFIIGELRVITDAEHDVLAEELVSEAGDSLIMDWAQLATFVSVVVKRTVERREAAVIR